MRKDATLYMCKTSLSSLQPSGLCAEPGEETCHWTESLVIYKQTRNYFILHSYMESAMHKSILVVCILIMTGFSAHAIEAPSLSLGKTLFDSTQLGTKERSCAACHPQGKGLDMIGDFNDTELKDIINACLRDALGAQIISPDSQEMNALVGYVRLFQKAPKSEM